jgi:hypothetical protein
LPEAAKMDVLIGADNNYLMQDLKLISSNKQENPWAMKMPSG